MESLVRKRVTKVGSGAWSIYLPKKWIDAWSPEQQASREVDLRTVSQSILITPVMRQRNFDGVVDDLPGAARGLLLSGYIRGYHAVTVKPRTGTFGNDTISMVRDFLRHLDERLVADCRPEQVGFVLRSDIPAAVRAEDLLSMLAAKVAEVHRLATDAIVSGPHDPERTLHALRLLRDTQSEDVDRLFYQAARLVATLEIPLESVSQYQLLGLVAADLQRIGEQGIRIAQRLLQDMGLSLDDLDYPRNHLLERMKNPLPPAAVARELIDTCGKALAEMDELLSMVAGALLSSDIPALSIISARSDAAREQLQDSVLAIVAQHWGTQAEAADAMAAFTASKHATAIQNALEHLHSICRHGMGLLAAS